MDVLKSKSLLVIVPHFQAFIKDQASTIRPFFKDMTVLLPTPHFSRTVLRLPYIEKYFRFLRFLEESFNEFPRECKLLSPKFLTLPIGAIQKRNCYLSAKSCVKILKDFTNIDLMHAHFLENGFIGAKLKSLYDKPLVVTAHGGEVYDLPFRDSWHRNLARYVLNEADKVITVSQFNAERLLALGLASKKLRVISNGYDEKLFRPIPSFEAREKLCLPLNKKILLAVGNLVEVKGHTYLIDAINFVLRKRNDVILVIVGFGYLKETLQKKVDKLDLKEKVFLVGGKNHEEIPIWMNACDVFVLPSLKESFGVVIIEAMACGKPVVGTCVGGVPEIIRREYVGILVKPADPKSLSEGILEALDRKWMPDAILNYAEQYSWTNMVERILEIYREVLQNQS